MKVFKYISNLLDRFSKIMNNNFNKIIIGIFSWGLLYFFNIIGFSFMGEFYSIKHMNDIEDIFEIFIVIFLLAFLCILVVTACGGANGSSLLVIGAATLSIILTVAPYSPAKNGLSFYQVFVMWIFLFVDIILSIWIARHLHPMKDLFVTKEVKKSYVRGDMSIEETVKSYPVVLPIIISVIGLIGAIISSVIK